LSRRPRKNERGPASPSCARPPAARTRRARATSHPRGHRRDPSERIAPELAQVVVHERGQAVECRLIATSPRFEKRRDVRERMHPGVGPYCRFCASFWLNV
jgi:hypothetical protein